MMQAIDVTAGGAFGEAQARGALGGARLVSGVAAGEAVIREGSGAGRVLIHLKAAAALPDDCFPGGPITYQGQLHVTITGTPASVVVYQV